MRKRQTRWAVSILLGLGVAVLGGIPAASAQNGQWTWGSPGWSYGFELRHVENALIDVGLADPNRNYFTPHLPGSSRPSSEYTGVADTGYRNTYAVNHDINTAAGLYPDVVSPLFGTNALAIGAAISSIWDSIQETVSDLWSSFTGLFRETYYDLSEFEGYSNPTFDFDNGFEFSFGGYESWGGGGGGGGGDDDPGEYEGGCDTDFLCPLE